MKPDLPSKLYKYRPINEFTYRLLEYGELKFSTVYEFNDPFEGQAVSRLDASTSEGRKYLHKVQREAGIKSPANRLRNIEKIKNKGGSFVSPLKSDMEEIGIFSLSEINNDLLMWAHYAKSHTGICIEFDTTSNFFSSFAHPVEYTDDYPIVDRTIDDSWRLVEKMLLTKSNCWHYEREWRLIMRTLSQQEKEYYEANLDSISSSIISVQKGPGIYVLPYDITGIIFGIKTLQSDKEKIINILSPLGHKVRLKQAIRHSKEFRIEIEDI